MLHTAPIKDSFVQFAELKLTTVDTCSSANCTKELVICAVHRTATVTLLILFVLVFVENIGLVTMSRDLPSVGDVESSSDTMKILLASDIHLGYMENDGIRGKDAMNAFEEVLQLAQKNDVDFVLLGGDLFHENKPSRHCVQQTIELLRKYCLGDKPCEVRKLIHHMLICLLVPRDTMLMLFMLSSCVHPSQVRSCSKITKQDCANSAMQ